MHFIAGYTASRHFGLIPNVNAGQGLHTHGRLIMITPPSVVFITVDRWLTDTKLLYSAYFFLGRPLFFRLALYARRSGKVASYCSGKFVAFMSSVRSVFPLASSSACIPAMRLLVRGHTHMRWLGLRQFGLSHRWAQCMCWCVGGPLVSQHTSLLYYPPLIAPACLAGGFWCERACPAVLRYTTAIS